MKLFFSSVLTAALATPFLAGCGADDNEMLSQNDEQVGSAELLLAQAPSDASCLQVSVTGTRGITKRVDLTPGSTPKIVLNGLPVGGVKVDATAYATACAALTPTSVASYVLEKPVTTRIGANVAKIVLKLVHNGRGELSVDFESPPWLSSSAAPVDLAVIGDTPYGAEQIADFPQLLANIDADDRISTVIHLGDIKSGSTRCDDAYFADVFAGFSTLTIPLVYTPGDNEWTDCHRANNGGYDPVERLDFIRKVFFSVPGVALGGGLKQLLPQSDDPSFENYVENAIWFESSVAFGTVHVVGSNDSALPWYTDDKTGTKVDDPLRRDAERLAREVATLAWIDRLFNVATEQNAAGVALMMQADMFDPSATPAQLSSFAPIVQKIAARTKAFGKPVLLLEGDSHVFGVDNPLATGNSLHNVTIAVPNLTRIVVQGSTTTPKTEWLRLHVDAGSPSVFTWERHAR